MLEEYIKCVVKEYTLENIENLNSDAFKKKLNALNCLYSKKTENVNEIYSEWKALHEYKQPGISDAGVVLLAYSIIVDNQANIDIEKFKIFICEYFKEEFKNENIFGIFYMNDETNEKNNFFAFCYPMHRRVLNPREWEYREKMLPDKWKDFIEKIQIALGIKQKLTTEEKYIMDDDRELEDKVPLEYVTPFTENTVQLDRPYDDVMNRFKITYNYFYESEHRVYTKARRGEMYPDEFLELVRNYLNHSQNDLSEKDKSYIVKQMYTAIYEYYVLTPLINDPKISDIKVININDIRVKVKGKRYTSNLKFDSEEDYESFIDGIAIKNGINLVHSPMSHFVDKNGSDKCIMRFNIMTPYVASSDTSYLHIRKISKIKPSLNELIKDGMLTKELAQWFIKAVKYGRGIIFIGRGGSGKTTLMNVLLEYIPFDKSILICQDNEEMFSEKHPDCMFVHTVEAMAGRDEYQFPVFDLKSLTKNGLLIDIDYFIIGEIKGAEAMYFLNASKTGAKCMASLHDDEAKLDKLADYVMYESKYNRDQALHMLKNIQYIVHMDEYQVKDINETMGWNQEKQDLDYRQIYNSKDGLLINSYA